MKQKFVKILQVLVGLNHLLVALTAVSYFRTNGVTASGIRLFTVLFIAACTLPCIALRSLSAMGTRLKSKTLRFRLLSVVLLAVAVAFFGYKNGISPREFGRKSGLIVTVGVFTLIPLILLALTEMTEWWENTRKYLFFNKVVNPFDYEFLLTFDVKNEALKFFGKLREIDRKRFGKWIAFMCMAPLLLCAVTVGALAGVLMRAFAEGQTVYMIFAMTTRYCTAFYVFVWILSEKASVKFFGKKK